MKIRMIAVENPGAYLQTFRLASMLSRKKKPNNSKSLMMKKMIRIFHLMTLKSKSFLTRFNRKMSRLSRSKCS